MNHENQGRVASLNAVTQRGTLAMTAALATFIIFAFMAMSLTNATVLSSVAVCLFSLAFAAGVVTMVASTDPTERRRVSIGLGGVVVLCTILLLLNHDLLTGDVSLQSLKVDPGTVLCGDTPENPCTMDHLKYMLLHL